MAAVIKKDTKECVFYSPNYILSFTNNHERIFIHHPSGEITDSPWMIEDHEYHNITPNFTEEPPFTDYMYIDGQWIKKTT